MIEALPQRHRERSEAIQGQLSDVAFWIATAARGGLAMTVNVTAVFV